MLEVASLSPEERAGLGAAGRARVEAGFSEERVAALYLEAIEEALKSD
jgi:glycosyltransferase involved in cell wall biosynthesis